MVTSIIPFDDTTDTLNDLVNAILPPSAGISVDTTSIVLGGLPEQVSFFDSIDFGMGINLGAGVMFSSGDNNPPLTNTETGFTVDHEGDGDPDFDIIAEAAFPGSGETFDASFLSFSFEVTDTSVNSIAFDIVFGSDEFPEYSDSDFVDIGSIIVNGENVALFNGEPAQPLSVISTNVDLGNFVDNTSNVLSTEYDGVSRVLSIAAPVKFGDNTIKLGVADTGDHDLDSALFVSNFRSAVGDGGDGGIFTNVTGTDGDDTLMGSGNDDSITGAGGDDCIEGTPEELNGDIISDFMLGDKIVVKGALFDLSNLSVEEDAHTLVLDTDQNGNEDTSLFLEGKAFNASNFKVSQDGLGNTVIELVEPDEPIKNAPPIANDDFFSTDDHLNGFTGGDILGNDSDPNGDPFFISFIEGNVPTVNTPILLNSGAEVTVNEDGTFNYDPNGAFDDLADEQDFTDFFSYAISDGKLQDDATVEIYVENPGDTPPPPPPPPPEDDTDPDCEYDDTHVTGTAFAGDELANVIVGTGENDTIEGFGGNDKLDGKDGHDLIFGDEGNDYAVGGDDFDTIYGGAGSDHLNGQDGEDYLDGGDGVDKLFGGHCDDTLIGGANFDRLYGEHGNDKLYGGTGKDFLDGGIGVDFLRGQEGNDSLYGGDGNDDLRGDSGDDRLIGGDGFDKIRGGDGDDRLIGHNGIDHLWGGAGADVFDYDDGETTSSQTDVIFDFEVNVDSLDFIFTSYDSIVLGAGSGSTLGYTSIGADTFLIADDLGAFELEVRTDGGFDTSDIDFV